MRLPAKWSESPIRVGSCPRGLAIGDGSVWVANVGLSGEPGTVIRIDAATAKVVGTHIPVDAAGIAAGEGSIWVTAYRDRIVTSLDPSSGEILVDPIKIEGRPLHVAVGQGAVWVTVNAEYVARIDPRSRDIVDRIPIRAVGELGAIATGEGGVWVSLYDDNAIARIQP